MFRDIYREIEYFIWKIHKEQQHLIFLDNCRAENIYPKFCQIPHATYKKLLLQPQNSIKIQKNILNSEYEKHAYNLTSYQDNLNHFYHLLLKTNPRAKKNFSIMKSRIQNSESLNDRQRDFKFQNILKLTKKMIFSFLPKNSKK